MSPEKTIGLFFKEIPTAAKEYTDCYHHDRVVVKHPTMKDDDADRGDKFEIIDPNESFGHDHYFINGPTKTKYRDV